MTTDVLRKKTTRYLQGRAMPAESKQIQAWLSSISENKKTLSLEEKAMVEAEILEEIQAYTAYPLFFPRPEPWWQKLTSAF